MLQSYTLLIGAGSRRLAEPQRHGSHPPSLQWSLFPRQGFCTNQGTGQLILSHYESFPSPFLPPLPPAHFPAGSLRVETAAITNTPGLGACNWGSRSFPSLATTSPSTSQFWEPGTVDPGTNLASSPNTGLDLCLGGKRGRKMPFREKPSQSRSGTCALPSRPCSHPLSQKRSPA